MGFNTTPDRPTSTPEVPETPSTRSQLDTLMQGMTETLKEKSEEKFDAAVAAVLKHVLENGEALPDESVKAFAESLSEEERVMVLQFLANETGEGQQNLRYRIESLRMDVDPSAEAPQSQTAAGKIIGMIDGTLGKMNTGDLGKAFEKFGFKPKEGGDGMSFLRNLVIGFAAKTAENVVLSLRSFMPGADVSGALETALELRLSTITNPEHREKYREAYLAWAANPATPTPPSLQQVLNPKVAEAPKAATPDAKTLDTAPKAADVVDTKTVMTFPSGANLEIDTTTSDVTLTSDGKTSVMKIENLQSVAARATTADQPGTVEFKLADARIASVTPEALRDAVKNGSKDLATSLPDVKIEFTPKTA